MMQFNVATSVIFPQRQEIWPLPRHRGSTSWSLFLSKKESMSLNRLREMQILMSMRRKQQEWMEEAHADRVNDDECDEDFLPDFVPWRNRLDLRKRQNHFRRRIGMPFGTNSSARSFMDSPVVGVSAFDGLQSEASGKRKGTCPSEYCGRVRASRPCRLQS